MVELTNDMLNDILKESGGNYFFHREDVGKVEVVFESGVEKFEPGEEDFAGRLWNPPITDAQGNPILDFNGNPREPWAKFEAKVFIDGAPKYYSFGGARSKNLTSFIEAMKREEISNKDLPGTKWSIERIGKWDWTIKYLGKEGDVSKTVGKVIGESISKSVKPTDKKSSW